VIGSSDHDRVELVARFTAKCGREEEVSHLLLALAENVREEPGCLVFEPYRVAASPAGSRAAAVATAEAVGTGFVVLEAYRDDAAFAAHLAAPYGAAFNAALGPLIVEDGSALTFLAPLGRAFSLLHES
jgi:quinol monooxygenase YgiN